MRKRKFCRVKRSTYLILFSLFFFKNSRLDILKIHASKLAKHGEIDYEACAKLAEGKTMRDFYVLLSYFLFIRL